MDKILLLVMNNVLLSISDHSDYLEYSELDSGIKWKLHRHRIDFGKLPITKGMFIPCDLNGNPYTEERIAMIKDAKNDTMQSALEWKNFIEVDLPQAKERVMFEGFEVCTRLSSEECYVNDDLHLSWKWLEGKSIEYLVQYELILKENFAKQFRV